MKALAVTFSAKQLAIKSMLNQLTMVSFVLDFRKPRVFQRILLANQRPTNYTDKKAAATTL